MTKSTDAQVQARVDAVFELLLQGASRRAILQYAANHGWERSPRQIDTYIARAREEFARLAAVDRCEEFGTAVAQLRMLFMKALAKGDLRSARAIRKDLTELFGLAAPAKLAVEGDAPIKVIIGIDPDDA